MSARAVTGQYHGDVIRRDVLSLRNQGLISDKSDEAIRIGCAKIDAEMAEKFGARAQPPKYITYSPDQQRARVVRVDKALAQTGGNVKAACAMAGVNVKSYHRWKKKFSK